MTCPHCGRCPGCGLPAYPRPYPTYPSYPYWTGGNYVAPKPLYPTTVTYR